MQQISTIIQSILEERARVEIPLGANAIRRAGVLIPLFKKDDELHLLVARRSGGVATHKHQISFPGGLLDDDDVSIEETALRENFEEMGVKQSDVKLLGKLDDYYTITNFVVTPIVGVIPYPYEFKISRREVAYLIEVPLAHLMSPRNKRIEYRQRDDGSRRELLF